ncbi:MAG: hypothetical protein ACXABY_10715 [Candidatus Thorarchaeota archaeon]
MTPDERLLAEIEEQLQNLSLSAGKSGLKEQHRGLYKGLLERCVKTIKRLKRQHKANLSIVQAAKDMYESGIGITREMRDALELYDGRKNRPMSEWPSLKKLERGQQHGD